MQKWEYCAVVGIGSITGSLVPSHPYTWHFTKIGVRSTKIAKPEVDGVAKAIAELGEQGWELVGAVSAEDRHILYFKRPLP